MNKLILIVFFINSFLFGQIKMDTSKYENLYSVDQREISSKWKKYILSIDSTKFGDCSVWLNNNFVRKGNCNLLSTQGFFNPSLFNLPFRNQILSISKLEEYKYLLQSQFYLIKDNQMQPFAISKVLAYKKDENIYFSDYLIESTNNWRKKQIGNIVYHYPKTYKLNISRAKRANDFINKYKMIFDIEIKENINYFIAQDCSDVFKISGFDFAPIMSNNKNCAFYDTNNNIIYSTIHYGEFHTHELSHILNNKFPNAHYLLLSGITIYSNQPKIIFSYNFYEVFNKLLNELEKNKNFRLDLFETPHIDSNITSEYLIGAILIDSILEKGGINLLKFALSNIKSDEDLYDFIEKKLNINREQIDEWLRAKAIEMSTKDYKFKFKFD